MNYYEHWLGDYRKKTAKLRLIDHGSYRLLLDEYYANEEPLPALFDDLFHVCRAVSKAEQDSVRKVADLFFPIGSDGLRHNERADEEISKAQPRIRAAKENGKKGGRRSNRNPSGSPTGTPTGSPSGIPPGSPMAPPPATHGAAHAGEAFPHTPIPNNFDGAAGVNVTMADSGAKNGRPPFKDRQEARRRVAKEIFEGTDDEPKTAPEHDITGESRRIG